MLKQIRRWSEARRLRRQLSELDDRMLADIGLTRGQVMDYDRQRKPWQSPGPER